MIRLRIGYLITGIVTGLFLVLSFFTTIPDGKLHIIICDVGQGDGIYVRFPDGKDLIIDGGPGNKIIGCLSRHMPFWDRIIDMAILTHPQKDHMNGLIMVLERYRVQYVLRSDVGGFTDEINNLTRTLKQKQGVEKFVTLGQTITVGSAKLSILWPTKKQIILMNPPASSRVSVLGSSTTTADVNDASVVFSLSYGMFDALFMGDADSRTQPYMPGFIGRNGEFPFGRDNVVELLKVPHHGSKTGMTDAFLKKVSPVTVGQDTVLPLQKPLAVISVGTNSYGHPSPQILQKLELSGFRVLRTDKTGDIEIVSDGKHWQVKGQ